MFKLIYSRNTYVLNIFLNFKFFVFVIGSIEYHSNNCEKNKLDKYINRHKYYVEICVEFYSNMNARRINTSTMPPVITSNSDIIINHTFFNLIYFYFHS